MSKKFNPNNILEINIQARVRGRKYWEIRASFRQRPKLKGKIVGLLVVLLACHLEDIQITGPFSIGEDENNVGA